MGNIGNIRGFIHSVRDDRMVLQRNSNFVHILFHEKTTQEEKAEYKERIGKGCSVWVSKGLVLLPRNRKVPMVAPLEYGYKRRGNN